MACTGRRVYVVTVAVAALLCVCCLRYVYVLFLCPEQTGSYLPRSGGVGNSRPGAAVKFNEGFGKRILVTGGAGFLGSHLVDRLLREGHRLMVVDNLFTGQRANVAPWLNNPRFQLVEHDVNQPLVVEKVDEIYHLACPSSPPVYMANPVFTITTNTLGTLNMLELARRTGAKFLLASTSEIYGDPQTVPQTEEYRGHVNPVGSRSPYDEGKRAAEALVTAFHKQYGLAVRIARISNSYGPRLPEDGGGVVGAFIKQALRGQPLYIYGAGNQTRCLQHVSDVVEGLILLMASSYDKPLNLAGTEQFTILELARHIISAIPGSRSRIVRRPPRKDDPQQRRPDISKAMAVLHWAPTISLKEGLGATMAYFQRQMEKSPAHMSEQHTV